MLVTEGLAFIGFTPTITSLQSIAPASAPSVSCLLPIDPRGKIKLSHASTSLLPNSWRVRRPELPDQGQHLEQR